MCSGMFQIFSLFLMMLSASLLLADEYYQTGKITTEAVINQLSETMIPTSNPEGSITIVVNVRKHLGYIAYAQSLVDVFIEAFPDHPVKVIIESSVVKPKPEFMLIPSRAEVMHLHYGGDKHNYDMAQQWLAQSSIIFSAASAIRDIEKFKHFKISQLGHNLTINGEGHYIRSLIDNYLSLNKSINNENGSGIDPEEFLIRTGYGGSDLSSHEWMSDHENETKKEDFIRRVDELVLEDQQIRDFKSLDPMSWSHTLFREGGIEVPIPIGLGDKDVGIILRPSLIKKTNSQWDKYFEILTKSNARLSELFLASSVNGGVNESVKPHYYMAYLHSDLNFAEYISTINYIEGDRDAWIFSNISDKTLYSERFQKFLVVNGISKINYTNLQVEASGTVSIPLTEKQGSTVNLIRLPKIKGEDLYSSLFANSQNPVGTTSNQSLFNAIALGKLPFYSPYITLQANVNLHLARFDMSGRLQSFFSNLIDPKEKARVVMEEKDQIDLWLKNVQQKSANSFLIDLVKKKLEP